MKRLPHRAEFKVTGNRAEKRVRLQIGIDIWSLSSDEAIQVANKLIDATERLAAK